MKLYKDKEKKEIYLLTVTRSMGSCRCGDYLCKVFPDGTIQYAGGVACQRSPRISGAKALESRPYGSHLGISGYNAAMAEFRRLFKKCGDSVFTTIGVDKCLERIIQIRGGKMRYLENSWRRNEKDEPVRVNRWTEWREVSSLPKYLNGDDICYRFADRVARGEITFPDFEDRFGNNS